MKERDLSIVEIRVELNENKKEAFIFVYKKNEVKK